MDAFMRLHIINYNQIPQTIQSFSVNYLYKLVVLPIFYPTSLLLLKQAKKKPLKIFIFRGIKTGDTYFRSVSTIIGSESLTSVFGMGTGGTFRISSPEFARFAVCFLESNAFQLMQE